MNQIIFDTAVIRDPETFAFVTLPEPACEIVPVRGDYKIWILCTVGQIYIIN